MTSLRFTASYSLCDPGLGPGSGTVVQLQKSTRNVSSKQFSSLGTLHARTRPTVICSDAGLAKTRVILILPGPVGNNGQYG